MDDLTTTTGIVALAAVALALAALVAGTVALVRLRHLRAAQRVILGGHGERDLVTHGAELTEGFEALRDWIEEVGARLDGRLAAAEERLDGAIAYRGLLRYDAYNEMSGRQSTSIALLDATRSGIVLSSIHHRDQARLYAKQVRDGQAELELSPEEAEAVRLALAGEVQEAPR
ncbi:MAG: DUF4446 family protein [Actinobacteria bacterium]|nr:MAG: DUF4446 family protein [Actinomycetota bacterium]